MENEQRGWFEWCRQVAADYRRGAASTGGRRSENLSDLAAHYEAQAGGPHAALAGNKPSARLNAPSGDDGERSGERNSRKLRLPRLDQTAKSAPPTSTRA
jgi:hypothetical protein